MIRILKGGRCYCPDDYGMKNIVILYDRVYGVLYDTAAYEKLPHVKVYDCSNKIICPGFIVIHVHILGGGGEQGEQSRLPEIGVKEITAAGVTTLVGVLGTEVTKDTRRFLRRRGNWKSKVSTYIYTGSSVPPVTATGSVLTDGSCG